MNYIEYSAKNFGSLVRQKRLQKQISQEKLAHDINLDRSYISSIKRGVRNPSIKVAQKVSKALGIKLYLK
jgi:ribosome-binding protein aMBF1 (putative translation factor)